ncbi:MAG: dockerin type I repeat-containing protein [bacterium]|nr:dockerin type I repeat-containing protein [bacterium]
MSARIVITFLMLLVVSSNRLTFGSDCTDSTLGLVPLTELTGTYLGQLGGLYPAGLNVPPAAHDSAGKAISLQFLPLDTAGVIDPVNGVWVLLSVGMSNCTQEFTTFMAGLVGDTTLHPRLRIVDGAQGGQTAFKIQHDTASFWNNIDTKLATAGFTRKQVQAIWFKEADASPSAAFPVHANILRDEFVKIAQVIKSKFPNSKQLFASSRTYAGYASTGLNPEPYAYESAFAVRWLIEAQISGNDSVNFDPALGVVNSPWLAWGPYLWADGVVPRALDSLQWFCSDFITVDGTHPDTSGRAKVANLLEQYFKTSDYSKVWFLKGPVAVVGDADGNGQLTISDAVYLINYVFSGGPSPDPIDLGDADCTRTVTISDAVYLIRYIFAGGPAPCRR